MHLIQERAATHDADSLWLEVLVENDAARRLYRSLGYREQRQLLIWERSSQQRTLTKSHEHLMEVEPHQILDELHQWHMLRPTWQRRAFHLRRSANLMSGFTVPAKDGSPVAYALCRETKGTRASRRESPRPADSCLHIFDAAAHPAADFQDAMHSMLRAMHARYTNSDMILLNEPADSRLNSILAEHDFEVTDRQHELLLNLT